MKRKYIVMEESYIPAKVNFSKYKLEEYNENFVIGLIVVSALCFKLDSLRSAYKQFVLTIASYPIFVNGVEYKDAEKPILIYK
jgi:hypothetical protein